MTGNTTGPLGSGSFDDNPEAAEVRSVQEQAMESIKKDMRGFTPKQLMAVMVSVVHGGFLVDGRLGYMFTPADMQELQRYAQELIRADRGGI